MKKRLYMLRGGMSTQNEKRTIIKGGYDVEV